MRPRCPICVCWPRGGRRAGSLITPTGEPEKRSACTALAPRSLEWSFSLGVLQDVSSIDVSATILGRSASMPLVFGPTGFTRMMHTEGESAVARVAQRVGIPYALSTMGTTSIEQLAGEAPGCRRWFQLYLWRDRAAGRDLVQRAQAAGYEALVLTVDTPVPGPRRRDVRNGLTLPPSLTLGTFVEGATHPRWWFDLLSTDVLEFATLTRFDGTVAELAAAMFDPAATMADLAWLREVWAGRWSSRGCKQPTTPASWLTPGSTP